MIIFPLLLSWLPQHVCQSSMTSMMRDIHVCNHSTHESQVSIRFIRNHVFENYYQIIHNKSIHLESRVDSESSQTPEKLLEVVEHGNYTVPCFDDFISLSSDLSSSLLISLCYFGFGSPQWYLTKHYVSLLFKVDVYVSFSRMF